MLNVSGAFKGRRDDHHSFIAIYSCQFFRSNMFPFGRLLIQDHQVCMQHMVTFHSGLPAHCSC